MKLNAIEKKILSIEKVLDKGEADPDQAAVWFQYGFEVEDVQRYMDVRILDPHTAQTLCNLGCRVGLIKRGRRKLVREQGES